MTTATDIAEVKSSYQERNGIVPEKKLNHQANIVRINAADILPHPDPETTNLELILLGEFQVVVRKGTFKPGDLGVYIQPDSVVPQTEPFKFIWGQYVYTPEPPLGPKWDVPERRRRITVRKFRGQWSEGLLLPLSDFTTQELIVGPYGNVSSSLPVEGEDVSERLGVTHWNPDSDTANTKGETAHAPRRRRPKTLKGWFHFLLHKVFGRRSKSYVEYVNVDAPVYDVEGLKNHPNTFEDGEQVYITEKIHGSNARYVYLDGVMYAGSRTQWKSAESTCVWRKALLDNPWIEEWCKRHEGFILYGEVTPTQKGFDYGVQKGQVGFFLFDIRTPEGQWVSYEDLVNFDDPFEMDEVIYAGCMVPGLYVGPYSKQIVDDLVSGPSMVHGAKHIREGIVIKPIRERTVRGVGRVILKLVSNDFLAKDSK